MSYCNLREVVGDAGASSEGGNLDPLSMGLPSLVMKMEDILGDRSRPAADRADEIRKLVFGYMKAGETDSGVAKTAESFFMAVTGRSKDATQLRESRRFAESITTKK